MITDERISELEQYISIRSDGDAKIISDLLDEIRRLRNNAFIAANPARFVQVTDRIGIRDTFEGHPIQIKLPPIG